MTKNKNNIFLAIFSLNKALFWKLKKNTTMENRVNRDVNDAIEYLWFVVG